MTKNKKNKKSKKSKKSKANVNDVPPHTKTTSPSNMGRNEKGKAKENDVPPVAKTTSPSNMGRNEKGKAKKNDVPPDAKTTSPSNMGRNEKSKAKETDVSPDAKMTSPSNVVDRNPILFGTIDSKLVEAVFAPDLEKGSPSSSGDGADDLEDPNISQGFQLDANPRLLTFVKYNSSVECRRQFGFGDSRSKHCVSSKFMDEERVGYEVFEPWRDNYHKLRSEFKKRFPESKSRKEWFNHIKLHDTIRKCFEIMKDMQSKHIIFANWTNGLGLVGNETKLFRFGKDGSNFLHEVNSFLDFLDILLNCGEIPSQDDEYTFIRQEGRSMEYFLGFGLDESLAFALAELGAIKKADCLPGDRLKEYFFVETFWTSQDRMVFIDGLHKLLWKVDLTVNLWKTPRKTSRETESLRSHISGFLNLVKYYDWKEQVENTRESKYNDTILFEGIRGVTYDTGCHVIAYLRNYNEHPPVGTDATSPFAAEEAINEKFHFCRDVYVAVRKALKLYTPNELVRDYSFGRHMSGQIRKYARWN